VTAEVKYAHGGQHALERRQGGEGCVPFARASQSDITPSSPLSAETATGRRARARSRPFGASPCQHATRHGGGSSKRGGPDPMLQCSINGRRPSTHGGSGRIRRNPCDERFRGVRKNHPARIRGRPAYRPRHHCPAEAAGETREGMAAWAVRLAGQQHGGQHAPERRQAGEGDVLQREHADAGRSLLPPLSAETATGRACPRTITAFWGPPLATTPPNTGAAPRKIVAPTPCCSAA